MALNTQHVEGCVCVCIIYKSVQIGHENMQAAKCENT